MRFLLLAVLALSQNAVELTNGFLIVGPTTKQFGLVSCSSALNLSKPQGGGDDWFDGYDDFVETLQPEPKKRSTFEPRPGRSFGDSGGHDYTRHPSDRNDGIDVSMVNSMLAERLACRKSGDFDRADSLRDLLKNQLGVHVWDKERTWTTNPDNPRAAGAGRDAGARGGRGERGGDRFGAGRGDRRGDGRNDRRGARDSRPPRRDRDFGPTGHDYKQVGDGINPQVCQLSLEEINSMLAERLKNKMVRNFSVADDIQQKMESLGVFVHDGAKHWRADGVNFDMAALSDTRKVSLQYTYRKRAGDETKVSESQMEEIEAQIQERARAKKSRNFRAADDIKDYLENRYNVSIDDRTAVWFIRSESYVMSQESSMPDDLETIQTMVEQRWEAKKEGNYDLADSIRDELKTEYSVTIDDRMKEFTYKSFETRRRPAVQDPWADDKDDDESNASGGDVDTEVDALFEDVLTNGLEIQAVSETVSVQQGSEDLEALTIPELKERLREAGLPVSGRKAELVERLMSS